MIEFTALGIPRPKGSLRHIGKGRMIEQTDVKQWMAVVRSTAAQQMGRRLDGPCAAMVKFMFTRPASAKNRLYPSVRSTGDLDKLVRAVMDAIQPKDAWPGVIDDDSQIVRITASKDYGNTPGVHVAVWELTVDEASLMMAGEGEMDIYRYSEVDMLSDDETMCNKMATEISGGTQGTWNVVPLRFPANDIDDAYDAFGVWWEGHKLTKAEFRESVRRDPYGESWVIDGVFYATGDRAAKVVG
jgi:crossover junction endodeoxyribonuclease RusA